MPPCFVSEALKQHGPLLFPFYLFYSMKVRAAEWRVPPVPWIDSAVYTATRVFAHQSIAFHGYHRRRVHAWGRATHQKMNGITRRLWYEALFQLKNGYYRDEDPKGRRPNATDVANGFPPDPNPVWKGI